MAHFRNLPTEAPQNLASLITPKQNQVISMALSKSDNFQMALFTFADKETVSEEAYNGDTIYLIVEGETIISEEQREHHLKYGDVLCIPEGVLHAIGGKGSFKVLQITINN